MNTNQLRRMIINIIHIIHLLLLIQKVVLPKLYPAFALNGDVEKLRQEVCRSLFRPKHAYNQ